MCPLTRKVLTQLNICFESWVLRCGAGAGAVPPAGSSNVNRRPGPERADAVTTEWPGGCQGRDGWEKGAGHCLFLCRCGRNYIQRLLLLTRFGPGTKWVDLCIESGELWQSISHIRLMLTLSERDLHLIERVLSTLYCQIINLNKESREIRKGHRQLRERWKRATKCCGCRPRPRWWSQW